MSPPALRALDLKLLRDALRMRAQLLAIALVIACGLAVYVGMRATMRSLETARASYYTHERFGHVFARLERAPERVAGRLGAIPGVQTVQTRVVADVTLDVPGVPEAATGRLVSLPDHGRPAVNDVRLRSGRLPRTGRGREVLVSEAFAEACGLHEDARLGAVLHGRHEVLRIVGTALSPEYTYALGPGSLVPDDRRFGVLWMARGALAAAFDLEGAFNDVSLRVAPDADVPAVLARVDRVLERYGGLGAVARADQQSAFFLENELAQLRTYALSVPALFLAVAAFLLNVVVGRIVRGQREQIGTLKAFGYSDREVARHYAGLVGLVVATGVLGGILLGSSIGAALTRLYAAYYRLPELAFEPGLADVLGGVGITALAALAGAWGAVRRTLRLPPAEAMRSEAPLTYRPALLERVGLARLVPPAARIVLRELERRPVRAVLSAVGIALATALTVVNSFTFDSLRFLLNVHFGLSQREDVRVTLREPRSAAGTLTELEHLPGVLHAEPFREVPVRLRAGARVEDAAITGMPADATLSALLDGRRQAVRLPPEGLVLARKLAELLDVRVGEAVRVEIRIGERRTADVPVERIVETYVGTAAYMELGALCRMLGEALSLDGAWLAVDDARIDALHAVVKRTPVIAGAVSRDRMLANVRDVLDENLGTWVAINLAFSLAMAFGVLYNAVRVVLAERARELASLRVLGFRRREVAAILLGELGLLVSVAVPLGLVGGRGLATLLVRSPGFDTNQFRIPLVISPSTYATAVLAVLVAAAVSAWSAWRRLDRTDLVEVLKSRD